MRGGSCSVIAAAGFAALLIPGLARADDPAPTADAPAATVEVKPDGSKPVTDPHDPIEDPHSPYRFIGLRFRDVVVPKFMINIFASGGATVNVPMVGPELGIRRDHLEYDFAIQYADYSMKPFLFKGKTDGEESFEIVSSSMKLLYFTMDILYDVPLDASGRFSFLIGGGVGLAPVLGNLYRNQVFPKNVNDADPNNPAKWTKCVAPGNPGTLSKVTNQPFCDASNKHYGNYDEPSWANGGSKPFIFPWIALPQFSFRYKPVHEFETRLDVGFSITGFFVGLTAAYGL